MNIRKIAGIDENYSKLHRGEINPTVVLYYLLLQPDNLDRFLGLVGHTAEIVEKECGIYLEYAYPRDLWNELENNKKRKIIEESIKDYLPKESACQIRHKTIPELNEYFGTSRQGRQPSSTDIESPQNWNLEKLDSNMGRIENKDFQNICKFKWSFNAKPDMVIHTSRDTAVCIEAKLESKESFYPNKSNKNLSQMFQTRRIDKVGQTELQRYLMEDLLGIKTDFVFLTRNGKSPSCSSYKPFTWKQVFDCLNWGNAPRFMSETIEFVSEKSNEPRGCSAL